MNGRKKSVGTHLLPDAPPARLPEEELLARLRRGRRYRRSASLLHTLLYRPRRLLDSGGRGRRTAAPLRRELGYRLVAAATSLALLISMVSLAPFSPFSLTGRARAAGGGGDDYSWLLDPYYDGSSAEKAYQISGESQLTALANLVEGLTTEDSTMTFTHEGNTYVVGPDVTTTLPSSSLLMESLETDNVTQPEESAAPTQTPEPGESPSPSPTESESPAPAESASPAPVESTSPAPSEEPAPEPTQEPAPLPSPQPEEAAAHPSLLSALFSFFTGGKDLVPTQEPQEPAEPGATPEVSPSVTPPQETTPAESIPPVPSETPAPAESIPPVPSEEPAPSESISPVPSETPAPTESIPPVPSETPAPTESEAPTPSPEPPDAEKQTAAGNTGALMMEAMSGATYSVKVPIGMKERFFKLSADVDLSNYDGKSGGGASFYWTPIGILSSFDTDGLPSGTPFLGTFDGDNHTVKNFYYAPDPAKIAAGYGLFGYIGTDGSVKNLNVTPLPWVLSGSLGGQNYALGVVAAASSGVISGCTVTQADLSYTVAGGGSAITSVGGIVGLVYIGSPSTNVDSCIFLGKLSNTLASGTNTAAANQRVGGVAGSMVTTSVTSTPLSNCAAGVDIDIHNGPTTGAEGGVGGLVGYCGTTGPLTEYPTVARSFTTGRINSKHDAGGLVGRINAQMTWQDCFSTAALGVTAKNSPSVDLLLSTAESIGGLIGNNQAATTLSNVYFAGGLLAPQFGSIVGQQGNTLTLTNTVVDGTQTPQDAAKYAVAPITASYDLGAFVTQDMGDAWDADPAYLPQLGWASESISDTVKGLSHSAAKRWFTPDVTNSVMGSDGTYSLFRLKDVSGAAPDKLGAAENILTRTRNLKSGNVIIGGIYTGATPVSGTSIPAARWAVTAANQTEGSANVIDTGTNLLRFLDRVNLAGGGYLGADFTLSGTISGTAIPAYAWTNNTTWSGSTTFPFCGKLTGGAGSALSKLNYSTGATGLFNTAFKASFQDLMFKDISIGNIKLGNSSSVYFGLLAGRMASSSLNNVDINGFSYACQDSYTLVPSATLTPTPIGLVGTIPSTGVSANFTDCDVTGLAIDIKAANVAGSNLVVYVGGLVGSSASSSISITNCTVSGSISATLTADSTVESTAHVGGFIGYASGNSGNIKVTGGRVIANLVGGTVGGLIGRGRVETLTNCLFSGNVSTTDRLTNTTAASTASGGLVGYNAVAGTVTECAVFGNVNSRYYAGGLIGYSSATVTIRSSYASAIVKAATAGGAAGGLVGYTTNYVRTNNPNNQHSYFVGQVWAPGPYGAFVGQTTSTAASTFSSVINKQTVNSLYDSTLTQRGIALVGSYVTAPTGGAAAKPGDNAWTALANSAIWTYPATGNRNYPQLKWMTDLNADAAVQEISRVSTYQLFDNPSAITSLYSMTSAHPFSVTLPEKISAFASTPNSFVQSSGNGSSGTTAYTVTGTDDEGPLKFTYSDVMVAGAPLSLSYTIAKQSFTYGDGTASKPFIIYDLDQLEIFRDFVNSGKNSVGVYYQISEAPTSAGDNFSALAPTTIDMVGINWPGTLASLAGQLDGHGSTLENLTTGGWTNSQGTWSAGLLGGLGDGSSVKDLTITNARITGVDGSAATSAAGILSATARGATVTNVRVDGAISAGRNVAVGGLVGSSVGPLSLTDCHTDVAITALGGDGADAIGAGGLVGSMGGVGNVKAAISQCSAQGSLQDWGGVGGLVGYVSGSAFILTITNSYSLVNFSDTGVSNSVQAGGFLGRVVSVNGNANKTTYIKIDSCYYAGENNISTASSRLRGGFVGGATTSSTANGFGNLNIVNCAYNTDGSDIGARANLSYSSNVFTSEYSWSGVSGSLPGLAWVGDSPAFQMSQVNPQGVMAGWDDLVWKFADGFYPHLKSDTAWSQDSVKLAHLAIHYTKATRGTRTFSNVFVRAAGAALSTAAGDSVVRVTNNERMAVATCPGVGPSVSLTAKLGGEERTVSFIPSTNSSGSRDVSIYYVNPGGMWGEDKVWTVYTADALAGLSTLYSADTADQNGLPSPSRSILSTGEIRLGRDIDLGANYSGMGDYDTWRPIGSRAIPFSATLNGDGKTLYNLAVNPFYYGANLSDAALGLFGAVGGGGTVKNLNLAAKSTAAGALFYRQPGVRVAQGVRAAGALTAELAGGRLENCLVSIPVYTLADTPADPGYATDWSAVPYLGASPTAFLGGLVGRVTADSSIVNCGYTGFVYADPKTPRPGSGSAPDGQTTGPVGGLVGSVATGKSLTVTQSYAVSYVGGSTAGALVGDAAGALYLNGAYYDANSLAGDVPPLGSGLITGGTASGAVPAELGDGWLPGTPDGLYPLQSALSLTADTISARMRISLSPNAGSATSGALQYPGGTLVCPATQPGASVTPGTAAVTDGRTFTKTIDGLTQLELGQNGTARRVLINLRCWYDDVRLVDGVRHYTITTAEELWELGQLVGGFIGDSGVSKVAHTHAPSGGYDDFSGAMIHLATDIDLTKLTDQIGGDTGQRLWFPIGTEAHPFNGTFEGGGHLVFGMLSDPAAGAQGLFGTVAGAVQNLLVSGASLKLPAGGMGGVLAARLTATGSLLSCGVSGSVSAEGAGVTAGGLAGSSAGTVTGSFSTAELTAAGAVSSGTLGGLVGSLSGGSVTQSYFTGFINAPNVSSVGGIAAEQTGGTVSSCYVSAYLDGAVVYRISKTLGDDCRYDGRHLSKGTGGTRQDGAALAMTGLGWTPGDGEHYPFPARFSPDSGIPDLSTTPLGAAAKLAAAIFTFGGSTGGGNYARFQTVTAPALAGAGYVLRSGNSALLTVSDGLARPVDDSSGEVALRLCLSAADPAPFQRPCWLSIPSALAVSYRFNWDELIAHASYPLNPKYNTSVTAGGSAFLIRTAADWNSFVAFANSNSTAGKTFVLDHDIDFGGVAISTVTAPFYGSFQGGGHTLSNFKTSAPLFASVAQGGKVEFLALQRGDLEVTSNTALVTALVAGTNAGRVANVAAESCTVTVTRTVTTDLSTVIGGLVGQNSGTLDTCYFYTPTIASNATSQVTSYYPPNTTPTRQRLGGMTGINTGSITGCYAAFTPLSHIGSQFSGNTDYYSALAGLNDGGSIRYSYWRFAYDYDGFITLTAYKNSDGTNVAGPALYAGTTDLERTALWLSADSYGGSYYVEDGRLKLYSFKLARYDLSSLFGTDAEQYLMLALQFGTGENAMSSNAICSWKDYLLPNFANLPKTSFLTVRIPVLSPRLTYRVEHASVIRKTMSDLAPMDSATVSGAPRSGYSVTGMGDNSTRVILDLRLEVADSGSIPWGVYRSDSTLPKS